MADYLGTLRDALIDRELDRSIDVREGPDSHSEVEAASAVCLHEHSYTTMCGVTRCLVCDKVVG